FVDIPMDSILIEQVLLNLLENAVFHAKGMTELSLSVSLVENQAVFEVADNGCGIPEDALHKIFTGNYEKTAAPVDGTRSNMGIGLSVCAAIIKAHGSEIFAETGSGGAVFRFALEGGDDDGHNKYKILIVEDEANIRSFIDQSAPAIIRCSARKPVRGDDDASHRPDLSSDLGLPDRDGLDLIREVRKSDAPRHCAFCRSTRGQGGGIRSGGKRFISNRLEQKSCWLLVFAPFFAVSGITKKPSGKFSLDLLIDYDKRQVFVGKGN
ncbi:MAG: ATP-binding protein, partial [Christensenellales bacterium]